MMKISLESKAELNLTIKAPKLNHGFSIGMRSEPKKVKT